MFKGFPMSLRWMEEGVSVLSQDTLSARFFVHTCSMYHIAAFAGKECSSKQHVKMICIATSCVRRQERSRTPQRVQRGVYMSTLLTLKAQGIAHLKFVLPAAMMIQLTVL